MREMQLLFEPQSFHLDKVTAEASVSRGWRLAHRRRRPAAAGCQRPTIRQWHYRPGWGDRLAQAYKTRRYLQLESEIIEITPSRSKPQQGIVTVRSTMFKNAPQRSTGSRDSGDASFPMSVLFRVLAPPVSDVCSPLASLGTKSNRARAKTEG